MDGSSRSNFSRLHDRVLVLLACSLSVTVILKIASIQYLEYVFALDSLILIWLFLRGDCRVRIFQPFWKLWISYVIFAAVAFVLAVLALRQNLDVARAGFLQLPVVVTVARTTELFLDVFYALYLAAIFRENEQLCAFGARTYFWMGVAGGLYSLATLPLNLAYGANLGTYTIDHRFRGFDNEGGPYGVYLLSLFLLCFVMRRRGWLSKWTFWGGMILFSVCLAGAQSKASFFGIGLLGFLYLVWSVKGWKRPAMLAGFGVVLTVAAIAVDLPDKFALYASRVALYQPYSVLHSEDANIVQGRIAGAVLAPRMIAAHPLDGVGWGNYALVRDEPEYRQGAAFAPQFGDAPSLGVIDYIVDLGIPLWLYLTWINFKPVFMLRRRTNDATVLALAAMQPVAIICGTHLNITYQWITLAIALGIGFNQWPDTTTEVVD